MNYKPIDTGARYDTSKEKDWNKEKNLTSKLAKMQMDYASNNDLRNVGGRESPRNYDKESLAVRNWGGGGNQTLGDGSVHNIKKSSLENTIIQGIIIASELELGIIELGRYDGSNTRGAVLPTNPRIKEWVSPLMLEEDVGYKNPKIIIEGKYAKQKQLDIELF